MDDYIYNLSLDLNCNKSMPSINSAQFDKGRKFAVSVTSNGEPFSVLGCEATLKCVHSDKSSTSLDCTEGISQNGTTITITLREDTLPVRGMTAAKIVFSDGTRNYSTQIFLIDVDSSLDGNIRATEAYSVINKLIDQIHALNESGLIIVDNELSESSKNPVENQIVKANINLIDNKYSDTVEQCQVESEGRITNWMLSNVNGLPVSASGTGSSIIIDDVVGGETIKISAKPFKTNFYCAFFSEDITFDSSKTNGGFSSEYFIGGLRGETSTNDSVESLEIDVPINAKKVIVSAYGSSFTPKIVKKKYLMKKKWLEEVYKKEDVDGLVNAKADKSNTLSGYGIKDAYTKAQIDKNYSDIFDKYQVESEGRITNWMLSNVNGLPVSASGTGSSIIIDDVVGGETIKISAKPYKTNFYCAFFSEDITFDSSKTNGGFSSEYFIGGLRGETSTSDPIENLEVEVPPNAKKVIVSAYGSSLTPKIVKTVYRKKRKWSGKKWCAVGDSFTEKNNTATQNYTDYIAEATGIEVINKGLSGSGYKQKESSGQAFYQRINEVPTDSDVVTICGSFNDAGYIYGDPLTRRTYAKSFDDPDKAEADAAIEATRIPWNQGFLIDKHGEIKEIQNTSYAVTDAIPVLANRYYRIKTKMKYNNAFFVFKDGNSPDSDIVYVQRVNDTSGSGSAREYDSYVKAPNDAKYLFVSTAIYGDSYETTVREDTIGTVDDGLVSGDVSNGQETEDYTTTLCGCINSTINNLYKRMPTVNLGIIASIPWIKYNAFNSPSCIIYIEALESICKKRGIPFLNLFYESNLRPWNQEFINLMYKHGNHDHPDEDAHKLFAPRIEAFLDKLLLH